MHFINLVNCKRKKMKKPKKVAGKFPQHKESCSVFAMALRGIRANFCDSAVAIL